MKCAIVILLICSALAAPDKYAPHKKGASTERLPHHQQNQLNREGDTDNRKTLHNSGSHEVLAKGSGEDESSEEEADSNDEDPKVILRESGEEKSDIRETRIIGGTTAVAGEFPYQASIQSIDMFGSSHVCGGVILSELYILTAAQCVYNKLPKNLLVVVGVLELNVISDRDRQERDVQTVVWHPSYDAANSFNDIAILKLWAPLTFNARVGSIDLASYAVPVNTECVMTGWGATTEGGEYARLLQKLNMFVVGDEECRTYYSQGEILNEYSNESMLCAFGANRGWNFCQGDEGGPLACGGTLHGLASWGYGCGRGHPGVFTDIDYFRDWIQAQMGGRK